MKAAKDAAQVVSGRLSVGVRDKLPEADGVPVDVERPRQVRGEADCGHFVSSKPSADIHDLACAAARDSGRAGDAHHQLAAWQGEDCVVRELDQPCLARIRAYTGADLSEDPVGPCRLVDGGGASGTAVEVAIAQARDIPVLPFGATGGTAARTLEALRSADPTATGAVADLVQCKTPTQFTALIESTMNEIGTTL